MVTTKKKAKKKSNKKEYPKCSNCGKRKPGGYFSSLVGYIRLCWECADDREND